MNLKRKLTGFVVYFPPAVVGRDGRKAYGTAVELKARWENQESSVRNPTTGETWQSKAMVYLDTVVEELGVLWHGRLADKANGSDPFKNDGASQIRMVESIPSRKQSQTLYVAYL